VTVPWARAGSRFTLLFRASGGDPGARDAGGGGGALRGITDKRLWRASSIMWRAPSARSISLGARLGLDETASKRGHNYVTVFIDMDRADKPVIFATRAGKGLRGGIPRLPAQPSRRADPRRPRSSATCRRPSWPRLPPAPKAAITVDWFHVVQIFTTAVDQCAQGEARSRQLPKAIAGPSCGPADGRPHG